MYMSKAKSQVFVDTDGVVYPKSTIMATVNSYNPADHPGEDYSGKASVTQPDEAYTIAELFDRFQKGLPLNIQYDGQYDGDSETVAFDDIDMTKFSQMDFVDQQKVIEEVVARGERAKQLKQEMDQIQSETLQKDLLQKVQAEWEAKQAAKEVLNPQQPRNEGSQGKGSKADA